MSNTCNTCRLFRLDYGTPYGVCWGTPPPLFANGQHTSQILPPPKVRANRPQCSMYQPLESGESNVRTKADPETPADATAAHIKHVDNLTAKRAEAQPEARKRRQPSF